jgi:hypothetical protein
VALFVFFLSCAEFVLKGILAFESSQAIVTQKCASREMPTWLAECREARVA